MSDIQSCNYLEMCMKESLRLYPSVQFISRAIEEDLQLSIHIRLCNNINSNSSTKFYLFQQIISFPKTLYYK